MFLHRSQLALGEAYLAGDFSIERDLESSFRLADHLTSCAISAMDRLWIVQALLRLPAAPRVDIGWRPADLAGALHSRARDRRAVTHHYDTSNEFFALWLDAAMVYSCVFLA